MQRVFGPPFGSIPMQPPLPYQGGFIPPSGGGLFSSASSPFSVAGQIGGPPVVRGGGGLLARLFGGGAGPFGGFSSAAGGMNLTTMLTNTQRVLGITQQVMPMVQQYGPLIRNMPTIWRIMRNNPTKSLETIEAGDAFIQSDGNKLAQLKDSTVHAKIKPSQLKRKSINGIPEPKLYI